MSNQSGYKKQYKLAFMQFLAEAPGFVAVLVSAILSKTLLVFVDLLDAFGCLLRSVIVMLLSKKLTKDLRFEYNYGIGKIEAISSLLCDGIVFFGLLLTLGLSVYSIIFPSKPSDFIIAVIGLKAVNVTFDLFFFTKQRKIMKAHNSAIAKTNYAAATASLLFDSATLLSLLLVWLLRNNPIGGYVSPVLSIFIAIYLMLGCAKRTKAALEELTDKTLPEALQMKILNILTPFYNCYSQFHSINSHKSGNTMYIDLHLSFDKSTTFEEIIRFKEQIQDEFNKQLENCTVNIIMEND